ncbi:MAG: asparagine synthase-related protein [Planctomycetota bacterium]
MCGIVGVRDDWLRERGSDPAAAMARAVDRLRWRGPDGTGMLRIGPFWLGCARLAISGPRCRQPVARRGGRFAGVMNGAITNARELWAELLPRIAGRAALPNDVWLPLLAVASGRRDLLGRFRGHHAFAVVDAATGELVLRRDRFGEKPLFAARDTSGAIVAFASTPPALAVFGVPPVELEPAAAAFFRRGFAAFAPAAAVAEPLPARALTEARDPGPGLVAGVARCADAAVPVALALSGGIDSSCLAAALAANARRVPAYQFRAAGAEAAEREVARAVATHCGLPFRPVDGGPEVLDPLPHLTRCAGMPLGDPSILAVHALARAAAADGIRVLLGGEGADELFFGYRRYRALRHLPRRRLLGALAPAWSMRYAARWLRAAGSPDPITELLTVAPPGFRRAALAPDVAEPPPRAIAERGAALAARARRGPRRLSAPRPVAQGRRRDDGRRRREPMPVPRGRPRRHGRRRRARQAPSALDLRIRAARRRVRAAEARLRAAARSLVPRRTSLARPAARPPHAVATAPAPGRSCACDRPPSPRPGRSRARAVPARRLGTTPASPGGGIAR